jgi:hypothetical protein
MLEIFMNIQLLGQSVASVGVIGIFIGVMCKGISLYTPSPGRENFLKNFSKKY